MMSEPSPTSKSSSRGRRRWIEHGLANRWIYRWTALGCATLPRWFLYGLSYFVNSIALILMGKTKRSIRPNYQIALNASEKESKQWVRRLFYAYGLMTVDLFRMRVRGFEDLPTLREHERDDRVVFRHLDRQRRGAILVTAHLGSWELGGVFLAHHGAKITLVGQPELDPTVQKLRDETRSRFGIEFIEIGSAFGTALKIRRAIDSGRVVAMVADRSYPEDQIEVSFFGQPTPFLRSPAQLARFCHCALIPCYLLRESDGSYSSHFDSALESSSNLPPKEADRELMNATARVLEKAIRRAPEQWYNFFNYWKSNH